MGRAALVFAICLIAGLGSAQTRPETSSPFDPQISQTMPSHSTDSTRPMWRRAWIQVVPLEIMLGNKAELESVRHQVRRAEVDAARLEAPDEATRELLSRQTQLLKTLVAFAEKQDSD